jgi:lipopolysaccharide biosynthesis protein
VGVIFSTLKKNISAWNRHRKEKTTLAYVSKKRYQELAYKYGILVESIAATENPLLRSAKITCVKSPELKPSRDVCFFVSYSSLPLIKPHVKHHIEHLLGAGIQVVLIINVDQMDGAGVDALDLQGLSVSGVFLRENLGFDFGAWSHLYSLLKDNLNVDRLFLINDSMIGPLSKELFDQLLGKLNSSDADFLGLIANTKPVFHLQSFFLVFKRKILEDQAFAYYFSCLWNFPEKSMVIDFYETKLTQLLVRLGYSVEAMYDLPSPSIEKSDAVIHRIDELYEVGFPYLKTSMVSKFEGLRILRRDHNYEKSA